MHLYKVTVNQVLTPAKQGRVEFTRTFYQMIYSGQLANEQLIFTDEAHFRLDGYVNKQNHRFWGALNPYFSVSKPLHPLKLTAWAAISYDKIYITFFTDNVTGESY